MRDSPDKALTSLDSREAPCGEWRLIGEAAGAVLERLTQLSGTVSCQRECRGFTDNILRFERATGADGGGLTSAPEPIAGKLTGNAFAASRAATNFSRSAST